MLSGTRVVYPAQQREVSIKLTNDDAQFPRLVQAWIDTGDENSALKKQCAVHSDSTCFSCRVWQEPGHAHGLYQRAAGHR